MLGTHGPTGEDRSRAMHGTLLCMLLLLAQMSPLRRHDESVSSHASFSSEIAEAWAKNAEERNAKDTALLSLDGLSRSARSDAMRIRELESTNTKLQASAAKASRLELELTTAQQGVHQLQVELSCA